MIQLASRVLIATILLVTASLKFFDETIFTRSMHSFHVPNVGLTIAACVEVLLAGLVLSRWHRVGTRAVFALSAGAILYLAAIRVLNVDIVTCGCFGARRVGWGGHLALLTGLMALCLSVLFGSYGEPLKSTGSPHAS